LFTARSKILVLSGEENNGAEILDLRTPNSTCSNLPNLPFDQVLSAIGGLGYKNEPLICGGSLGVNFINILLVAFTQKDSKSKKKQSICQFLWRFQDLPAHKLLVER